MELYLLWAFVVVLQYRRIIENFKRRLAGYSISISSLLALLDCRLAWPYLVLSMER